MTLIADILLVAGALGAAFYCFILGRRLRKFNNLESGMGGAVAVLSAQVDDLEKTLSSARSAAQGSAAELEQLTARAEDVRRQLEIQMASLHDIVPQGGGQVPPPSEPSQHDEVDVLTTEAEPQEAVPDEFPEEAEHDVPVAEFKKHEPAAAAQIESSEPMFTRRRVREA
jgi:hypothetical protein